MTLEINFTNAETIVLREKTRRLNYPSVEKYIHSRLFTASEIIEPVVREALQRAGSKTAADGKVIVKSLFSSDEWQELSFGERKLLGKTFFARCREAGLEPAGKNSSGQQQYISPR